MTPQFIRRGPVSVIGRSGSTASGLEIIPTLWDEVDMRFAEVESLAKKNPDGSIVGFWGLKSDLSLSFDPWTDVADGLYLAGVECEDDAEAPDGWTKWTLPPGLYLRLLCDSDDTYRIGISYIQWNRRRLTGAVQDFRDASTGENYMFFTVNDFDFVEDMKWNSTEPQ